MSATPLYLLTTRNDASANPIHILTNGKASVGSNSSALIDASSGIISTCTLNVGSSTNSTNMNVYGTYYSNNVSALKLPADISLNRPPGVTGYIRFNTSINVLEYWRPTDNTWLGIDIPPLITSISPSTVTQANFPITITGGNFVNGMTVIFIDISNNTFSSPSVTFVSSASLTALTPTPALTTSGQPFSVKVVKPSGSFATLLNALNTGGPPTFISGAGVIGRIYTGVSSELLSYTNALSTVKATDPDSDPITYSYTGSLPPGLSLDASGNITGIYNGTINAPSASPSSTTYNFTVSAVTSNATSTRTFDIIVVQPTLVSYTYSGSANVYSVPTGVLFMTTKMWAGGGANYFSNSVWSGSGAPGGFTETTFNIISGETSLTIVVAGGGGSGLAVYDSYAYGGGGNGVNGGAGAGGGSMVLSGNIPTPFANATQTTGIVTTTYNAPQAALLSLNGAEGVIAVAGGGGGAGWYNAGNGDINQNGGPGGGITGGQSTNSRANRTLATGGTQTAGGVALSQGGSSTSPNYMTSVSYLKGSGHTNNFSSGGSGAGGGGWYGGGGYQGAGGDNAGGGGGSGFAGYVNGSTSSTLTANTLNWSGASTNSYTDSTTRTNGTRTYTNSQIYRKDNLVGAVAGTQTPPGNSDTYYVAGVGQSGPRASEVTGGNGYIVFIY